MSDDDSTRSAGRGGLAVTGAKIYFILLGLLQQIALPRVLGLSDYGALSRVLSLASIVNNSITTMSIQGVSRTVVQAPPEELPATIRRVLGLHALFGLIAGLIFAAFSGRIARLAGAEHVATPLCILSGILVLYSVYTPLMGIANGQRRFVMQAGFDETSATLRTLGLVLGAVVARQLSQSGPAGAALGFVVSAVVVLLIAASVVGVGRAGESSLSAGHYFGAALPILFGQLLLNLLFQADLTLLGRFASQAASAAGALLARADTLVGAYRATQLFSFLPYQILIAVTFVLFPMLARAAQLRDSAAVARYVRTGMRLSLIIAGAIVSTTLGLAPRLLELLFGAEAAALGGRALGLLALGLGAFAIFGILTTILNSLGRERQSLWVTAFAASIVVTLCFARASGAPLSEQLLWLTAQATSIALFSATLLAALLVHRAAGAVVAPSSLVRTLLAVGVAAALSRTLLPPGKLFTLVGAAMTPLAYFGLLIATRELGAADLEVLRKVVRR